MVPGSVCHVLGERGQISGEQFVFQLARYGEELTSCVTSQTLSKHPNRVEVTDRPSVGVIGRRCNQCVLQYAACVLEINLNQNTRTRRRRPFLLRWCLSEPQSFSSVPPQVLADLHICSEDS